jgi:hypothetical protein
MKVLIINVFVGIPETILKQMLPYFQFLRCMTVVAT